LDAIRKPLPTTSRNSTAKLAQGSEQEAVKARTRTADAKAGCEGYSRRGADAVRRNSGGWRTIATMRSPAPEDASTQDPALLRRLLRARDAMDAASNEDWPVQRLAEISCVSPAHFARSFKQAFGVPPHRYLLTRRIERAVALLRDTDLPVTAIAFQTGWTSLGTFGRIFRDITGASPRAMRARSQAAARGLERVPACYLSAAQRPDLTIAVLEKRRRAAPDQNGATNQEAR
jgi:AraC-like DNA-binding protein